MQSLIWAPSNGGNDNQNSSPLRQNLCQAKLYAACNILASQKLAQAGVEVRTPSTSALPFRKKEANREIDTAYYYRFSWFMMLPSASKQNVHRTTCVVNEPECWQEVWRKELCPTGLFVDSRIDGREWTNQISTYCQSSQSSHTHRPSLNHEILIRLSPCF